MNRLCCMQWRLSSIYPNNHNIKQDLQGYRDFMGKSQGVFGWNSFNQNRFPQWKLSVRLKFPNCFFYILIEIQCWCLICFVFSLHFFLVWGGGGKREIGDIQKQYANNRKTIRRHWKLLWPIVNRSFPCMEMSTFLENCTSQAALVCSGHSSFS